MVFGVKKCTEHAREKFSLVETELHTPRQRYGSLSGPSGPNCSGECTETGRIRFRGVRFQTPSSVSFSGLTEFRGANSVSSFQPIICVPKRTHRVFRRTHRICPKTQWGSVSSLLRNSTLETVFSPFPKCPRDLLKRGYANSGGFGAHW